MAETARGLPSGQWVIGYRYNEHERETNLVGQGPGPGAFANLPAWNGETYLCCMTNGRMDALGNVGRDNVQAPAFWQVDAAASRRPNPS